MGNLAGNRGIQRGPPALFLTAGAAPSPVSAPIAPGHSPSLPHGLFPQIRQLACVPLPPIFYVVSPNQAFILNPDNSVDAGFFQSQTGNPFSNTSANGTYAFGTIDPGDPTVNDNEGIATFTSPNVTVTVDANNNGLQNLGKLQGPSAYAVDSTALGTMPSGCSITATSPTPNVTFYVISPTKAALLDGLGSTTPDIQIADN